MDAHLIVRLLGEETSLITDHPKGSQEHHGSVTTVSKHHGKQEGESDDGVGSCRGENHNSLSLPKSPVGSPTIGLLRSL